MIAFQPYSALIPVMTGANGLTLSTSTTAEKKRMTILSAINYTWLFHFRDEIDGLTLKFFYVVSLDRQLLELHLLVSPLKNVEKMRLILG